MLSFGERMSGMRFMSAAVVVMMITVMISVPFADDSAADAIWTTGDIAGYYKNQQPINDDTVYSQLAYTVYFSSDLFGQEMNTEGSDSFRNINTEYGLCSEVNDESMIDGTISNISGTTKATRSVKTAGVLFTSESPYSGELIDKINEHLGQLDAGTKIIIYDEFTQDSSSSSTSVYYRAQNGYVTKEIKTYCRVLSNMNLGINRGSENVSLHSTVSALYETVTSYSYVKDVDPNFDAPSKCNIKTKVTFKSFESTVEGSVSGQNYSASVDKEKFLGVSDSEYFDVSTVIIPQVQAKNNTAAASLASESEQTFYRDVLGFTVSNYYPFVKDKVDAALNLDPEQEGFDIMDIINSKEFKIVALILIIIALIVVIYKVVFYVIHRWL